MHKKLMALLMIFSVTLTSCSRTTWFVVRHGEKAALGADGNTDVPLSANGQQMAERLANRIAPEKVNSIWSTDYKRTYSTAGPASQRLNKTIEKYKAVDSSFVTGLKKQNGGAVLIVGHSNTVDDIVNTLTGTPHLKDLPDTAYNDLFIVTRKGKQYSFRRERL